ncbi:capsid staple protein [Variovorax sp. GT1P44]|uniref:capsid staple protein n=1 Tax=Variovorax sp. GT1P44 TaxID=3443742 RepID=UPI003F488C42
MISTKMSKEEAKEYTSCAPSEGNAPMYSYGTMLCLDDSLLKKLGFPEPPAVGTELTLTAKVVVTSTGVNQQQDGDKEMRCDMQITDMELKGGGPDAASVLYG